MKNGMVKDTHGRLKACTKGALIKLVKDPSIKEIYVYSRTIDNFLLVTKKAVLFGLDDDREDTELLQLFSITIDPGGIGTLIII